jgi:ubiquinol-cytochrome c reductase cytochrome b subunit
VFFTGAFRKPREINWLIGVALATLAVFEGFLGYSLPDDLLSGNGLRIIDGMVKGMPVVGTWISFLLFGGEFPGTAIVGRLYSLHILILPAIIVALIAMHLLFVVVHKHTQYPGAGRTNNNVVGYPVLPVYAAKAGGFFFIVFGVITLISAIFQINPIWVYGSYDPSPVSSGAQPDWYMGFTDGAVRLMPGWTEFTVFHHTFSLNVFLPGLGVLGLLATLAALYPWIESWATGDKREHHLLDRPRNAPVRTGLGAMAITFYFLLLVSGGNDIVAMKFGLSINDITYTLRLLVLAVPPLIFFATKRICLGLQHRDREKVLHGRETGTIYRTETGEFFEVHEPIDEFARWTLVQQEVNAPLGLEPAVDANGVRRPGVKASKWRARVSKFYFEDRVAPVTPTELEAAHHEHHGAHAAIEGEHARQSVTAGD